MTTFITIYILTGIYTAYFTIKTDKAWRNDYDYSVYYTAITTYILVSLLVPPAAFFSTLWHFDKRYWRFI